MSVLRSGGLTLLALAAISGGAAFSQGPPAPGSAAGRQMRRPTTSPYLNLLRRPGEGGRNLALEYYGTVRPQQQFRGAINRQSRSLNQLQRQVNEQGALIQSQNSQLGPTGHAVRFLDIGGYFNAGVP